MHFTVLTVQPGFFYGHRNKNDRKLKNRLNTDRNRNSKFNACIETYYKGKGVLQNLCLINVNVFFRRVATRT